MKMKWPKNDKPTSFFLLVEGVKDAILQGYEIRRVNEHKSIKWRGFNLPETATQFSIKETLSRKNLDFAWEDQGRDLMDELLGIAVRLGIEQGRRIHITEYNKGMEKELQKILKKIGKK